MTINIEHYW